MQNAGTLAGNLCTASPAADGVPPLLALDAEVELQSMSGARRVPVGQFVLGPRRTTRRADELVVALHIPDRPGRSVFGKLGARRHLVISIATVAVTLDVAGGIVREARVAVGACSPVAARLPGLEAALLGQAPHGGLVRAEHLLPLAPISDIRGSAEYRLHAVETLLRRALNGFAMQAAA